MRKKKSSAEQHEVARMFHEAMDAARKSGKTKTIQCIKCGADVVVSIKAASAKFCPKCAEEAAKEKKQAYREKNAREVTGICNRCGVEFQYIYRGSERVLCDDCKNRKGGRPKPLPKKRKKKRGPTIEEIERAAKEKGMSYGQYKAWLYIQEQKGAKKK